MDAHRMPFNRMLSLSLPSHGMQSTSMPTKRMSSTSVPSFAYPFIAMNDVDVARKHLYVCSSRMYDELIKACMHQQMVRDQYPAASSSGSTDLDNTFGPPLPSSFLRSATYLQHVRPLLRDEELPPELDHTGPSEALDLSHHTEGNINSVEEQEGRDDNPTPEEKYVPPVEASPGSSHQFTTEDRQKGKNKVGKFILIWSTIFNLAELNYMKQAWIVL